MNDPRITLRVEGDRLSPLQGLTNSINISIDTKCDEILDNPTTGSRTFSGRTTRISPPVLVSFSLHSSDLHYIRQILRTKLNTSCLMYESLASEISTAAIHFGFGFNGFVMNVFVTITYYRHTIELAPPPPPPANSNNDTEELFRMVLLGRIKREELESLKTETESCSICLDDLSGSNSKHGRPTRMTCSHIFHDHCLLEWLHRKNTCPLCRIVLYDQ